MDVYHLIWGRPWHFDVRAIYDSRANTFSFLWKGRQLKLLPAAPKVQDNKLQAQHSPPTTVSNKELLMAYKETKILLAVVTKEVHLAENTIPAEIQLLSDFHNICSTELPSGLPPISSIQHSIDFIPGPSLPNLPHYKINPKEQQILQSIIDDLLQREFIQPNMSPCSVPALLVPKKNGSWRMCVVVVQ